jgi:hypothetical protein
MDCKIDPPSDPRPAWFAGTIVEFEQLAALMADICVGERKRRRGLLARVTWEAMLLGVLGIGANQLVMADTASPPSAVFVSQSALAVVFGLVLLFECLRFIEGHLSAVELHARFATLATEVVHRDAFVDGVNPAADGHTRLYKELGRFAHARQHHQVVVPSLLRAGFTVVSPPEQSRRRG